MSKLFKVSEALATEEYNAKMQIFSDGTYRIIRYDKSITRIKKGYEKSDEPISQLVELSKNNVKIKNVKQGKNKNNENVRSDSIARSRQIMEDKVRENHEEFHSTWTLTFEGTPTDEECEKMLANFLRQMRRKNLNFKWVLVAEYQKRGVLHYHLLTNLKPNSELMPKLKEKRLWDSKNKKWDIFEYYDLKYWNYGYSQGRDISRTDDKFKVQKYLMKYMTKDSLQLPKGINRVRYSRNLRSPKEKTMYLDEEEYKVMIENFKFLGKDIETVIAMPTRKYGIAKQITTINTNK